MAARRFHVFDLFQTRILPRPRPYPKVPDGWLAVSLRLAAPPAPDAPETPSGPSMVLEIQARCGTRRALELAERLERIARTLRLEGDEVVEELVLDDLLPPADPG